MNKFLCLSVIAIAAFLFGSCEKHDPSYENVTRPVVKAANSSISGIVTDYQGNPLANAVININGVEIKTDENGFYSYDLTLAGEYNISASYTDKITQTATVQVGTVSVTQHFIQNFRLPGYTSIELTSGKGEVDTETIEGNELEGTVTITTSVQIAEGAIPEGAKLYLTPVYSQADGETFFTKGVSSHTEYRVLAGAALHCSESGFTEFKTPAIMTMNAVTEVQGLTDLKMYNRETEKWETVEYTSYEDYIEFQITKLTVYAIFGNVNISIEESSIPITDFKPQDFWDNYTGSNTIHVESVDYTRKAGLNLDVTQGVDQLRALLLEKLAQDFGLGKAKTVPETYKLNVDLPVGTAMSISGEQKYLHVTYERNGKSVVADVYGTTIVTPKTYNRVHTGGGNYVTY